MQVLEKHHRFWKRAAVGEPLLCLSREGYFHLQPFLDLGMQDGLVDLDSLPTPSAFLPYYRRTAGTSPLDVDVFWVARPPRALPWMEAISGCPIYLSTSARAMTALPTIAESAELDELTLVPDGAWLEWLLAFTDVLADRFGSWVPIGQSLLRGPSDILIALLGGQRFCFELHDHRDRMKELARRCTDLWIRVLQAQYEHIPRYGDGYVSAVGIWAPGPVALFQEDATGLLSPTTYRDVFMPCDATIAAAFEYSICHTHSTGLHILDSLLEIAELDAVNIVVESETTGPSLEALLPAMRSVQESGKALHLAGSFSSSDIERLSGALSPSGLCIKTIKSD